MRIAFIIQDLCSQGAQYATALMVRGFVAKGYDVDLILSKVHRDLISERHVPFEIPPATHLINLSERKARNNIAQIRRYLKTTDACALVTMSPNYSWAVRLASLFLKHKILLVHVEHELAGFVNGRQLPTPSFWEKRSLRGRFLFCGFDRILTVSSAGRDDFIRYYPFYPQSRVSVVYNPVIDSVFYHKRNQPARHPWLVNKTCPTFVSAGAYQDYKGHFDLLEAVRLLKDKFQFRVVVFGQGPLKARYEEFIDKYGLRDRIDFAGYTNNFPAEAKASDGFILSSRLESFGIVVVEALGCGCRIVSTDAPFGPCEILDGGRYGKLVPVKAPESLALGIQDLLEGKVPQAPDKSWLRFTIESAVARYEDGIGIHLDKGKRE